MKSTMERLDKNYLGLRVSDGGGIFIAGYVVLWLSQLIVLIVAMFFKKGSEIDIVVQYAFTIVSQVAFFITPILYGRIVNKPMLTHSRIKRKLNYKQIIILPFIALAGIAAFLPLAQGFLHLLYSMGYYPSTPNIPMANSILTLVLSLLIVCVLPAICEEFLFRDCVARAFKTKSYIFAIILSSLLFSLFHGSAVQTVHQFLIGLVFCFVYFVTGSLWASSIVHFVNNAFALVIEFAVGDIIINASQTGTIIAYVVMCIIGLIALIILLRLLVKVSKKEKQKGIDFKGFFTDFKNGFSPSGIKKNYKKLEATLKALYADPTEENVVLETEPKIEDGVSDDVRKMLIESHKQMKSSLKRNDRISVLIAIALTLGVWVINLLMDIVK